MLISITFFYFQKEQICDGEENLIFYLLFRSLEIFHTEYSRYPGESHDNIEADAGMLKRILNNFLNENRVQNFSIKDEFIQEV